MANGVTALYIVVASCCGGLSPWTGRPRRGADGGQVVASRPWGLHVPPAHRRPGSRDLCDLPVAATGTTLLGGWFDLRGTFLTLADNDDRTVLVD